MVVLAIVSLFVGVGEVTPWGIFDPAGPGSRDAFYLVVSRVPRTVSLILVGIAMSVAGLLMQMLTRNRFVEPSTSGATDAAGFGLLVILLVDPGMPILLKGLITSVCALFGVFGFLSLVRRIPLRSSVLVPVVGIMFGGVISAVTSFIGYRFDLLQALGSWAMGDFSGVLRGRYELLWLAAAAAALAWFAADRFTVAGLGEEAATGLGLNTRVTFIAGVVIVAVVTGVISTTTGTVPFLGLIVPNIVSRLVGDNLRRSVPFVALLGAGFLLACDLVGRSVRFPYEIPLGLVVGVAGSAIFLWLLLGPVAGRKVAHG